MHDMHDMHDIDENRITATPLIKMNQNVNPEPNNSSQWTNPGKLFLCEQHLYSIYSRLSQYIRGFINASTVVGPFCYYDNITVDFLQAKAKY